MPRKCSESVLVCQYCAKEFIYFGRNTRKYCSSSCRYPVPLRFKNLISSPNDNGCIEWKGSLYPPGYGSFAWKAAGNKAHRAAWILANGDIPSGMVVMHKCDNRKCVNVAHLKLGTVADNIQDMFTKNRQAKGESKANAKMTDAIVRELRSHYATNRFSHDYYAKKYKVSTPTICQVLTRRTWKHVE